ncbi:MAG: hypothetical protein NZ919_01315, partial [Candidatus Caldarchaeum sp.]|nr:hypothetical protein [Candidatus Caldarchaeum sp.]
VPFSSGGIPVQLLPPDAARLISLSPFFYAIHPMVASATGSFYIPPQTLFTTATILTGLMTLASIYAEKILVRKALKNGRLAMF